MSQIGFLSRIIIDKTGADSSVYDKEMRIIWPEEIDKKNSQIAVTDNLRVYMKSFRFEKFAEERPGVIYIDYPLLLEKNNDGYFSLTTLRAL